MWYRLFALSAGLLLFSSVAPASNRLQQFREIFRERVNSDQLSIVRGLKEGYSLATDARGVLHTAFVGVKEGSQAASVFYRQRGRKGQWGEVVELSRPGGIRSVFLKTSSDREIHVVWLAEEQSDEPLVVVHRRSMDGGGTWGVEQRFPAGMDVSTRPVFEVNDSGGLFVAYSRYRSGAGAHLIVMRSLDRGSTWDEVGPDSPAGDTGDQRAPLLLLGPGADVYLAWIQVGGGMPSLAFSASQDRGSSWSETVIVNDERRPVSGVAIASEGKRVYLSWVFAGAQEASILVDSSEDSGRTWGTDQTVYSGSVTRVTSRLDIVGSNVLVSWSGYWSHIGDRGYSFFYCFLDERAGRTYDGPASARALFGSGPGKGLWGEGDFKVVALTPRKIVSVLANGRQRESAFLIQFLSSVREGFKRPESIAASVRGLEYDVFQAKERNSKEIVLLLGEFRRKRFLLDSAANRGDLFVMSVGVR